MDAISFVLGEKTSNLRVKRLSVSNDLLESTVDFCLCYIITRFIIWYGLGYNTVDRGSHNFAR